MASASLVIGLLGVPLITPVAAFKTKPAGNVPLLIDHEYGAMPPAAASVIPYAALTCPSGRELVVICNPAGDIVNERFAVCERAGLLESETLKIKEVFATDAEGVPPTVPVEAFKDNPFGNVPLLNDQR